MVLVNTRPNNYTDCSIKAYRSFQSEWQHKTNIHHIDRRNAIQCIATILPIKQITILTHVRVITMWSLGGVGTMHIFLPTYYTGIMYDAFLYLLCSKLCRHNWRRPSQY